MDQLPVRRLFGPAVAMVLFALTIGAVAASGATHASARIVDAAGDTIGWARFVEDEAGRLHISVQVEGLAPGRHGIHLHSAASCVGRHSRPQVAITTRSAWSTDWRMLPARTPGTCRTSW